MENNKKENKLKKRFIVWFTSARKWVVQNPVVAGSGAIVVILGLLIPPLVGSGSSSSLSSSPVTSVSSINSTSTTTTASASSSSTTSVAPSSSAPLTEVTVTFDTQGGTNLAPITGLSGANITTPLTTTKFANIFVKFSSNAQGTDTLNLTVFPNTSLTAYAIWDPELFNVNFYEMTSTMTGYETSSFSTLYINDAGELFGLGRNTSGIYGNGATSSAILTVPVPLTSFLPLNVGESIANLRTTGLSNGGVVAMLLTTQNRLLVAGSNFSLIDGSQASSVNITTYKDITASLNLNGNETISELILAANIQGVRTSANRFILWGANNPARLFPQPDGIANFLPVGTPTDVTPLLTQPLVAGETIELLSIIQAAGVYKTSNNRYFVWGDNSSFALMMFQAQNFASNVPVEITTSVLNLIGQNNEIVKFVPEGGSFTMNFFTNDNKLYNYGDIRYVFLPNSTDRPTIVLPFFGDSTPLEISSKFELLEGEYPTHVFGFGFFTNLNRYRRGSSFTGTYALSTADLSTLLRPGETIVSTFGIQFDSRFTTSFGRVFAAGNSLTITNVTSATLSSKLLSTLALPYNEDISYLPVRQGFTFGGWFTDQNLTTPFTGKVPANNNLVLYGIFIPSLG